MNEHNALRDSCYAMLSFRDAVDHWIADITSIVAGDRAPQ